MRPPFFLSSVQLILHVVSMPAMLVVGAVFVLSVAKEFAGLGKVRRIQLNALTLVAVLAMLYLAASPLYVTAG